MLIPLLFYGSEHHWMLILTHITAYDSIEYRLYAALGICSLVPFSAETLTNCQDCNGGPRLLFDGRTKLDGEGCSVRAGSGENRLKISCPEQRRQLQVTPEGFANRNDSLFNSPSLFSRGHIRDCGLSIATRLSLLASFWQLTRERRQRQKPALLRCFAIRRGLCRCPALSHRTL